VKFRYFVFSAALSIAVTCIASGAFARERDQIRIVGSSTVFPYTQAVSEQYANITGNAGPIVESTGTGGGIKIFCGGIGSNYVDITGASRAMKLSEYEACQKAGVTEITEVLIGFDGLSFAHARRGSELILTKAQIFEALASEVQVDGKIIANPFTKWNEIDAFLPDTEITVFGPPPTSGTRDAFVELVMEEGCEEFYVIAALEKMRKKEVCGRMRQDGPFIEAGENDNLIVQRLEADPNAFGIFGYSFLYENLDKMQGVAVDGIVPDESTIADGSYPVSRPLFFYIKCAHKGVILGLDEFIEEYVSEDSYGDGGYLSERGLIPLSEVKREATRIAANECIPMASK